MTHNELFRLILGALGDIMMDVRRRVVYLPGVRQRLAVEHRTIADAVAGGDRVAARKAMEADLTHSTDIVQELDESLYLSHHSPMTGTPSCRTSMLPRNGAAVEMALDRGRDCGRRVCGVEGCVAAPGGPSQEAEPQAVARHPNVRFDVVSSSASWLNQIEVQFSFLTGNKEVSQ